MRKQELNDLIDNLKTIKNITDKQEYRVSSSINQIFAKVFPVLTDELNRMENTNEQISGPKIYIKTFSESDLQTNYQMIDDKVVDIYSMDDTLTRKINDCLSYLVSNGYRIIDYSLDNMKLIIKYTD